MFNDLPYIIRWLICCCWCCILLWVFADKEGSALLVMIFGWGGWIVCFGKEISQGHW